MLMKLFFLFFVSVLLSGCIKGESEIFLLPKNYTGYVLVLYNQKWTGAAVKYKRGKRVYEIPSNGIFKTRFLFEAGHSDFPKFYYEKIASENRIPYKMYARNIPVDTVVAFGGTVTNYEAKRGNGVVLESYYIGNSSQIDTIIEAADQINVERLSD